MPKHGGGRDKDPTADDIPNEVAGRSPLVHLVPAMPLQHNTGSVSVGAHTTPTTLYLYALAGVSAINFSSRRGVTGQLSHLGESTLGNE